MGISFFCSLKWSRCEKERNDLSNVLKEEIFLGIASEKGL